MKRPFALILAALAVAALFAGLVHGVLVAAQLSVPAATTVYGVTPRRLWATAVDVLALVGVVIGGLALARPARRPGTAAGQFGAVAGLVAGVISAVNGGLVLSVATGGSRHRQRSGRWCGGRGVGSARHRPRRSGGGACPPHRVGTGRMM
jgi:hypothetical protein